MAELEHIVAAQNKLGEGPLWHADEQALYWVDIQQNRVERLDPVSGERKSYEFACAVTVLGLRAGGGFITATNQGFAYWDGRTTSLDFIGHPEANKPHNRFNDGAVDPAGRFWAGTMYDGPETAEPTEGRLYRLDGRGTVQTMETALTISNGIGWSPQFDVMYLTDTLRNLIYAYDFDLESGAIFNRRTFVNTSEEAGFPDGLTVDSEGFVWSARWGGWKVVRYDPDGQVEREIRMPVECPTCCTFGGKNLNELYITSAWTALSQADRRHQPQAGDLFRLRLDIKGRVEAKFGLAD